MSVFVSILFAACSFTEPEPSEPVLEMNSLGCSITFGDNSYTGSITHLMQGITTITFKQPESISGLMFKYSGNGNEIKLGDLQLCTEVPFSGENSLPELINEVFISAQKTDALTYTDSETPNASTLKTAAFNGKTDNFSYEIITDFDSGFIREIHIDEYKLIVRFSAR